jgi:hypothetical protein
MTNASAETRLILLLLIVHGERCGFVPQSKVVLADNQPQFTNSQINRGYEYLVDEGYLWEIKNITKCPKTNRRKAESLYVLTPSTHELWRQTLNLMLWREDVLSVLRTFSNQLSSPKSQIGQKTDSLLVLIVLLVNANNARFVLCLENKSIGALLRLSEVRVRRALTELGKSRLISVVAKGLADTKMFGQQAPIYWIQPFCPGNKNIHIGVHVSTYLTPFRFIEKLYKFYKAMKKCPAEHRFRYSKQVSGLSDEMYFELAKLITPKLIAMWLHHVCLSTVFSKVPLYAEVLSSIDTQVTKQECVDYQQARSTLMDQVYDTLGSVLYADNLELHEYSAQDNQTSVNELTQLRQHTLIALTQELSGVIHDLAKQWRVFVQGQNIREARLIDHQRRGQIAVLPYKTPLPENSIQLGSVDHPTSNLENWLLSCVLTAYVPDRPEYDHCAVLGDELWMVEPSSSVKSVRSIKRLIFKDRGTVIIDKTAPPVETVIVESPREKLLGHKLR